MKYKQINSKMKEIYFSPAILKENEDNLKAQFKFWNSMNLLAMQNMSIQHMKAEDLV